MKEKKIVSRVKGLFESVSIEEKISGKMVMMLFVILFSFLMIAICIITLTQQALGGDNNKVAENTSETTGITEVTTTDESQKEITTIREHVYSAVAVSQSEFQQIIEAETMEIPESIYIMADRPGFSGDGYILGFEKNSDENVKFSLDIPVAQHYDISICFASDAVVQNELYLNDSEVFSFSCTEETVGQFVVKTYYGLFIEKGKSVFEIRGVDGAFELDYIRIQNNQSIYQSDTDISPTPVNPEASKEVHELMQYLADNFGENMITGQYVSSAENIEIRKIFENTSKYPVIRFGDMGIYSRVRKIKKSEDDVEAAIKWAEDGGIVGYVWHWEAPAGKSEIYADKTDFRLEQVMTGEDIAMLTQEQLEELVSNGVITEECLKMIKDIDHISEQLARLRDKNIPVLWRPLHEASGDWFWWGASGVEAYKWLWHLLYTRQTEYHKLDNLIWIWSAQGTEYFVGNHIFDIAAVDLYDENTDNTSYYKQYQWLYSLTGGEKLIALGECGKLPDMELSFRDNAVWSFFGLWYGDYILQKDGELSEQYNSREEFVKIYNSNKTITLDKYIARNKNEKENITEVTTVPEQTESE